MNFIHMEKPPFACRTGSEVRQGPAWTGWVRRGWVRFGKAWRGAVGSGLVRRGMTWRGMAGLGSFIREKE